MAGDLLLLGLGWNKIGQQTFTAGVRPGGVVEVETTGRILKNRGRLPGRAHAASISALLQEAEFEFKNLKHIALLVRHGDLPWDESQANGFLPRYWSLFRGMNSGAVMGLTPSRDSSHPAVNSSRGRWRQLRA